MTTTENTSINIALLVIIIATSLLGNSATAQETGRLFLLPGEFSGFRMEDGDGTVSGNGTIDRFHIASYSKSDKRIIYPVERQWSDNQQSGNTESGTVLRWKLRPGTSEVIRIDAPVTLSFTNTGIDADAFNLNGNTNWHLPNMQNLYASIDPGNILPSFYSNTASGSVFHGEDFPTWKVEKNGEDEAGFSEWSLPNNAKLKLILHNSLFPDITDLASHWGMFSPSQLFNGAEQNNYIGIDLENGRPFLNLTDFSFLSAQETGQAHYWSSNYYNDGTAYEEVDSVYDVNFFTIDTQGRITGITNKIKELLP